MRPQGSQSILVIRRVAHLCKHPSTSFLLSLVFTLVSSFIYNCTSSFALFLDHLTSFYVAQVAGLLSSLIHSSEADYCNTRILIYLHSQLTPVQEAYHYSSSCTLRMAPAAQTSYGKDEKVLCFHHDILYEAKILDLRHMDRNDSKSPYEYLVHYKGWKNT